MKSKIGIVIGIILILFIGFVGQGQVVHPKTNLKDPDIAVMYHHPELAEEYARETVKAFAPDPETLKITYCKAQYVPSLGSQLFFNTKDAYGEMQRYKIQMKVQVLPDGNGGIKYNARDFKELR